MNRDAHLPSPPAQRSSRRWTEKRSRGDYDMTTKALFVRLEAKPGKENEVAKFLRDGQGLVAQEPASTYLVGMNESGNQKYNFSYLANTKGVQKISY
jgi:hypothetical protein